MSPDVLITVGVGALSACVLATLAFWLRVGAFRTITAALAGGALGALVASEHAVKGAGSWWAAHPSTGAIAIGLLLLALTVLVVEAAVQREFSAAEEERWRPAGKVAASQILTGLNDPIRSFQDEVIWLVGEGVESRMRSSPGGDPDERARVFSSEVSRIVMRVAPVLSATPRLQVVYSHALNVAQIAHDLSIAVPAWQGEYAENASLPTSASESARLAWWGGIGVPWQQLIEAATAFEDEAYERFGASVEYEPWAPAWREQPTAAYSQALHEYLDEYRR